MTMLFQGVSSFFFTLATPFSLLFLLVGINATRVAPTGCACSAGNVGATLVVALRNFAKIVRAPFFLNPLDNLPLQVLFCICSLHMRLLALKLDR